MPYLAEHACPVAVHSTVTRTYTAMKTKLTLRLDDDVIARAKAYAAQRGTSVSGLVEDYFRFVAEPVQGGDGTDAPAELDWRDSLPPITRSLVGIAEGVEVTEDDYKRYLEEKHR